MRHVGVIAATITLAVVCLSTPVRADPTAPECAAATEKALSLRKAHKLRDARAQLLVCAAASCPTEIRDECARRIEAVNLAMPTIVFEAKDATGADVSGVSVTMDGQALATKLDGTAIVIEPGEHRFRFEAAGKESVERTFVIHEAEKDRRERVVMAAIAPSTVVTTAATAPPTVTFTKDESQPHTQRTIAIATGAAGLVGLAVGGVFGVFATVKWSAAKSDCGTACSPNAPAQAEKSDAQTAATGANIALIAGGVLLATGVVLWFTAPHAGHARTGVRLVPNLGRAGVGLTIAGDL